MSQILSLHPLGEKDLSDRPVVKVDYKDNEIKINFIFPGFRVSDAKRNIRGTWESFTEVKMSGTGFLSIDNEPLLPCLRRFVQIPPGYHVPHKPKVFKSIRKVFEKKLIIWAEDSLRDEGEIEFDDAVYDYDRFNPEDHKIVDIEGGERPFQPSYFYMNGYKAILVQVKPLQYNPKKRLLRGFGKIDVAITVAPQKMGKKKETIECALTNPAHNLEGFGNLLLNPKRRFFGEMQTAQTSDVDIPTEHKEPEFLIIYGDNLKTPAEKLKEWKIKNGIETEIKNINDINGFGENDADEVKRKKIKEYIRNIRGKPLSNLRYVLLFGDVSKIPLSQTDEGKATDQYFYTHEDPGDSECILPWVSGGRIPVETLEDGMSVVNKIIRYEKDPPRDPEYFKRMTFAAYFQDNRGPRGYYSDGRADRNFIKTMEDIRSHLICRRFKVNRVYVSQIANPSKFRDGTPLPQEVKDSIIKDEEAATNLIVRYINEGQLIIGYRGHGEPEGWTKPTLKNDDLSSIASDSLSLIFSINCDSGGFHRNNKKVFAENILTLKGGAPSLIASTESSWRWRNDSLIKALFDAIWPGLIPAFPKSNTNYPIKYHRLGDILNYAKAYLLIKHGCDKDKRTKEQLELYHVIGDPTLRIGADETFAPE